MRNLCSNSFESFLDCGTLIVYTADHDANVPLGNLQIEPKPIRVIRGYQTENYNGCCYRLLVGAGMIMVYFIPGSRPTLGSFHPYSYVFSKTFLSYASKRHIYRNHSVDLLLGPTDDDLIRILCYKDFQPVEIRTIGLTFSQLRARLIHQYELEYKTSFKAETVEVHPNAAAAYVMENPDGSPSANLLPSDIITMFPDQASPEERYSQ